MKDVTNVDSNSKSGDTPKIFPHGLKVGDVIKVYDDYPNEGKEVQNSTITHVEKDWFIAVEPDGKWYKIWNTGKREEVEPPQDTTIQDVVNGTPKGQAAVEKAIKDSIEVQNSMTKKAQDTSLDFIGCCGGGLARHEVCSHVKAYIKEEQAKLSQVIEDEVVGRETATYHDHPFLSDYAMGNIHIAVNDMMLYRKDQHFTKEAREWFENKINEIVSGELDHKCKNTLRTKQRQILKKIKERYE